MASVTSAKCINWFHSSAYEAGMFDLILRMGHMSTEQL